VNQAKLRDLLLKLNEDQLAVANKGAGPAAVSAAPGAGKTLCVVARIARVIRDGMDPKHILAVTFTRAAAGEMNERLEALGIDGCRVGTLHSVCNQLLVEEGITSGLRLMESDYYELNMLKSVVGDMRKHGEIERRRKGRDGIDVEQMAKYVADCKATGLCYIAYDPLSLNKWAVGHIHSKANDFTEAAGCTPEVLVKLYENLERRRSSQDLYSYDDMQLWSYMALIAKEEKRKRWRCRWSMVLMDEAPDSSPVQWDLVRLLTGMKSCIPIVNKMDKPPVEDEYDHNLMVVGDVAQSCYSFRSAAPKEFLDFAATPGVESFKLPRNYRSVPGICTAGSRIAKGWDWNLIGDIIPDRQGPAEAVTTHEFPNPIEEANWVISTCIGLDPKNCVILARLSASLTLLEVECIRNRLPYVKRSAGTFTESKEILDLMSYLRVAHGVDIDGKQLYRAINAPYRYIGKATIQSSVEDARRLVASGCTVDSPYAWSKLVLNTVREANGLSFKQSSDVSELISIIEELHDNAVLPAEDYRRMKPAEQIGYVLRETRYLERAKQDVDLLTLDDSKQAIIGELLRIAERFSDGIEFITYIDQLTAAIKVGQRKFRLKEKRGEPGQKGSLVLSTIHRCVHPATFTETEEGLLQIARINQAGKIGYGDGAADYSSKVEYSIGPAIRIVTEGGYELVATPNHGLMAWNGTYYTRVEASRLRIGQFLRLPLGPRIEPKQLSRLPLPPVAGDVREVEHSIPSACTEDVAEFLGLMVADGTVYHAGFRYVKHDLDVVERFSTLCRILFGVDLDIMPRSDCDAWSAECNSVYLSRWLLSIGGLAPWNKYIPECVLRSALSIQGRFLRGLCEDGGVNVRHGRMIDHVAYSSSYSELARIVQVMLLRFGIISRRFPSAHGSWRVDMSGRNAERFGTRIGFIAKRKQDQLDTGQYPSERMHSIPISLEQTQQLHGKSAKANARIRGCLSRATIEKESGSNGKLSSLLLWHHARIKRLEPCMAPSMCVEVPEAGRFLQNGFDGCNSKGLEFPHVFLVDVVQGRFPCSRAESYDEEVRLFYVAVTRAMESCSISYTWNGKKPTKDNHKLSDDTDVGEPVKSSLLVLLEDRPVAKYQVP